MPCVSSQELAKLLTSELTHGEASTALLPSALLPEKVGVEKGDTEKMAQPGLELARDVGRGKEDHLPSVRTLLPAEPEQKARSASPEPPISPFLPRPHIERVSFFLLNEQESESPHNCVISQKAFLMHRGKMSNSTLPEYR